jgi:YD repeat-containing protein
MMAMGNLDTPTPDHDNQVQQTIKDTASALKPDQRDNVQSWQKVSQDILTLQAIDARGGGNFARDLGTITGTLEKNGLLPHLEITATDNKGGVQITGPNGVKIDLPGGAAPGGKEFDEFIKGFLTAFPPEGSKTKTFTNGDGSVTTVDDKGRPTEVKAPNGESTKYTYGPDGKPARVERDNAGGSKDFLTQGPDGKWTLEHRPGPGDGAQVTRTKIKDGTVTFEKDGTFGYTTEDGTRVEQHPTYLVQGKASENGKTIARVDSVTWFDADGRPSGPQFQYDQQGQLKSASGFGTAQDEQWSLIPGSNPPMFHRAKDGLVATIGINADGTFTSRYLDKDGNIHTESQKGHGKVIRDAEP